jgi:hypothetical protein
MNADDIQTIMFEAMQNGYVIVLVLSIGLCLSDVGILKADYQLRSKSPSLTFRPTDQTTVILGPFEYVTTFKSLGAMV